MKKGFTAFEMLVAISIVGLLTAVLIPPFLEAQKTSKLAEVGIKEASPFFYNPETKEVVELSDDYTSVTRVIGVLGVSIIRFENTPQSERHKLISYRTSDAQVATAKDEIIMNGVTYKKVQ